MVETRDPNSPGYTNALLESIEDKFQIVVEATQVLPRMEEKLEATFEEVGKLRVDVEVLKSKFKDIHERLDVNEQAMKLLNKNTTEIDELRSRVHALENVVKA
jgi:tRNA(Phe) wybutosine-synthesizing methylase Tyw3